MTTATLTSKGQITIPAEVRVDFADCLIARSAAAAGCEKTMTFDRGAG
jgi:predicted nucleic-acid-binding protein